MIIRFLNDAEIAECYRVVFELRKHLDQDEFLRRVALQKESGYCLAAAFDPDIIGVIGMRPVRTLARGWHMHVDDLVVTEKRRKEGVGEALLGFAEVQAKNRNMDSVFLDSVATATEFYSRHGYVKHSATLMKKEIKPTSAAV